MCVDKIPLIEKVIQNSEMETNQSLMIRNQFPKKRNHLKFLQDNVEEEVAALRPAPDLLFMHLGSSDRVGEEDNCDENETKRLVMSWRGCLDLFLLILIWVLSLSMVEESRGLTEMVAIFEGETFSLLSFWRFKSVIAIDVKLREKREREMGLRIEKGSKEGYMKCVNGPDLEVMDLTSEIWFWSFLSFSFCGFSISWRDFCFVLRNGLKFSETWKVLCYGGNSRSKKLKKILYFFYFGFVLFLLKEVLTFDFKRSKIISLYQTK